MPLVLMRDRYLMNETATNTRLFRGRQRSRLIEQNGTCSSAVRVMGIQLTHDHVLLAVTSWLTDVLRQPKAAFIRNVHGCGDVDGAPGAATEQPCSATIV